MCIYSEQTQIIDLRMSQIFSIPAEIEMIVECNSYLTQFVLHLCHCVPFITSHQEFDSCSRTIRAWFYSSRSFTHSPVKMFSFSRTWRLFNEQTKRKQMFCTRFFSAFFSFCFLFLSMYSLWFLPHISYISIRHQQCVVASNNEISVGIAYTDFMLSCNSIV